MPVATMGWDVHLGIRVAECTADHSRAAWRTCGFMLHFKDRRKGKNLRQPSCSVESINLRTHHHLHIIFTIYPTLQLYKQDRHSHLSADLCECVCTSACRYVAESVWISCICRNVRGFARMGVETSVQVPTLTYYQHTSNRSTCARIVYGYTNDSIDMAHLLGVHIMSEKESVFLVMLCVTEI